MDFFWLYSNLVGLQIEGWKTRSWFSNYSFEKLFSLCFSTTRRGSLVYFWWVSYITILQNLEISDCSTLTDGIGLHLDSSMLFFFSNFSLVWFTIQKSHLQWDHKVWICKMGTNYHWNFRNVHSQHLLWAFIIQKAEIFFQDWLHWEFASENSFMVCATNVPSYFEPYKSINFIILASEIGLAQVSLSSTLV